MQRCSLLTSVGCLLAMMLPTLCAAPPSFAQSTAEGNSGRLEMEDKEVKGQRQGKNIVYLFDRQKIQLQSMVKKPTSFRQRILATVFDRH